MNMNKFQKRMFDRLLRGERVIYSESENQVILTDGFEAYVFFKNEICLNLDKCQKEDGLQEFILKNENDRTVTLSGRFYKAQGEMCCELINKDGLSIWAKEKFLKPFGECYTYRANSPNGRIHVFNIYGNLIAVVMPMATKTVTKEEG